MSEIQRLRYMTASGELSQPLVLASDHDADVARHDREARDRYDEVAKEAIALRAERDEWRKQCGIGVQSQHDEGVKYERELAALRKALGIYGIHFTDCEFIDHGEREGYERTCGLSASLSPVAEMREDCPDCGGRGCVECSGSPQQE